MQLRKFWHWGVMGALVLWTTVVMAGPPPQADPKVNTMPISWNQAYFKVIASPDNAAIERGEILYDMKVISSDTAVAQTMGLVNAIPEDCFKVVQDYNNYIHTMPYTDESKIVRKFKVDGANAAGADAVDFWTRVNVYGFKTGYLLRIVHLSDAVAHRYQSFWTMVHDPDEDPCADAAGQPCENDLAANVGSHLFEPYNGNPNKTLHTYTLNLVGKTFVQRMGLKVGGGSSMRDVTSRIRTSAEKKK
jgi:hypothetical protein